MKRKNRELQQERDEYEDRMKCAERRTEELSYKLYDLEREVRNMMHEREREIKDSCLRQTLDTKKQEESKGRMLEDI